MIDQTDKALRDTMATIVDVAPDAPELPVVSTQVLRMRGSRSALVAAAAFLIVLIVGVGTVVVTSSGGEQGPAGSSDVQSNDSSTVPTEQDVVAMFDAAAAELDPLLLPRTIDRVAGLDGVKGVAIVPADVLQDLLGWPEASGPGIVVSTSGNAEVAERAVQQIADGTRGSLRWVRFSAAVGEARVNRAIDVLTKDAVDLVDGLLLATLSGPEPQFDTGPLGQEMLLDVSGDEVFFIELASRIPSLVGRDDGLSNELIGTPVYLGRIGEVNGVIAPIRSDGGALLLCDIQNVGSGSSGMGCADLRDGGWPEEGIFRERLSFGATVSGDAEPASITLSALGEEVSVVAIELKDGSRYWQRPVGGSAFFVVPSRQDISFTATTLDSSGGVLITNSFDLNG